MGKIDDMRNLREQQFADLEKRRAAALKAAPAPKPEPVAAAAPEAAPLPDNEEPAQPTRPTRATKEAKAAAPEEGKCPECGKVKPLQNGVMASHQKGFGKACAGSRKAPA